MMFIQNQSIFFLIIIILHPYIILHLKFVFLVSRIVASVSAPLQETGGVYLKI